MDSFKQFVLVEWDSLEHDVLNMYYDKQNYKVSDISELTGVSTAGIYRILQKHEVQPGRRKADLGYETIYHYANSGVPVRRISELTGYSLRQVYNILEKRRQAEPLLGS
jgi:hypothetical protein